MIFCFFERFEFVMYILMRFMSLTSTKTFYSNRKQTVRQSTEIKGQVMKEALQHYTSLNSFAGVTGMQWLVPINNGSRKGSS